MLGMAIFAFAVWIYWRYHDRLTSPVPLTPHEWTGLTQFYWSFTFILVPLSVACLTLLSIGVFSMIRSIKKTRME